MSSYAATVDSAGGERRYRGMQYALANIGFALAASTGTLMGSNGNPRILYLLLLFALCSTPLLLAKRWNGRYTLLTVFFGAYLIFYGASDFVALFGRRTYIISKGVLSPGELAVLSAGIMTLVGYALAASVGRTSQGRVVKDWSGSALIVVGLAMWAFGLYATWKWQIDAFRFAFDKKLQFGSIETMVVLTGRLVQPLGITLLAYRYITRRSTLLGLLILAMLAGEFVFGFVADSKELSMRGMLLVIVCKFMLDGKTPKTWLIATTSILIVAFPVFQAYRLAVLGERGVSRGAAAQDIMKYLEVALHRRDRASSNDDTLGSSSVITRTALKPTMESIVNRVGKDVRYQNGYTIGLFFLGFVPRVVWHDKPDNSVGPLFNDEFKVAAKGVYISATHYGELYWNFGWTGLLIGSGLIGALLGYIARRTDLSEHRSITRLLVLTSTMYFLCFRYEGSIALEYTEWVRSLAVILLLHVILARHRAQAHDEPARSGQTTDVLRPPLMNGVVTPVQALP